jgi:hypothetical protein
MDCITNAKTAPRPGHSRGVVGEGGGPRERVANAAERAWLETVRRVRA